MKNKLNNLREKFLEHNIDGLLIMSEFNRRYMTNFTGTAGVVLISANEAAFITDFRYIEQAKRQAEQYEIVEHDGNIYKAIASEVKRLGIKNLGFEQDYVSFAQYKIFADIIKCDLIPVSNIVEKLRLLKDEQEINIIKEATALADKAFSHILTFIKSGMKEIEVANELEFFMRKHGADSSSFDIIVASGARSALPHGVASEKIIEQGDFVTLDFGAYYKGYVSDITRTIAIGEPSEQLREIYNVVLEAQKRGVAQIKGGMTGKEADAITRDYITDKGYGDYFGHSTGHGIGLEVHEAPRLSKQSSTVLQAGMVVTVEPGIYIPNVGGVRIEDDILITNEGNEVLTKSPKELIII